VTETKNKSSRCFLITQEALKTLSSGLHLTKPDKSLEDAPSQDVVNDPAKVATLMELFEEWCHKVRPSQSSERHAAADTTFKCCQDCERIIP
jgi:hypothetical protein